MLLLLTVCTGCTTGPSWNDPAWQTRNVNYENPVFLPVADPEAAWEMMVDVVDDYFQVKDEDPVRWVGDVPTEGRLDTFPLVGSTLFEPWRRDSANRYEAIHATLQSIRRRALVRMIPSEGGYRVDVAVFKELEDAKQADLATAGSATFRYDSSLTGVVSPIGEQEINEGWIPQGRDAALEQQIIRELLARAGEVASR
jgi:hypothetical protein